MHTSHSLCNLKVLITILLPTIVKVFCCIKDYDLCVHKLHNKTQEESIINQSGGDLAVFSAAHLCVCVVLEKNTPHYNHFLCDFGYMRTSKNALFSIYCL